MSKRKGFTLVEIVVAMGLISCIAVFLIGNISQSYRMMTTTKKITSDTFFVMKKAEKEIQDVKNQLAENATPANGVPYVLFAGTADEKIIQAYKIDINEPMNNTRIFTIIGERRIPEFPVPKITNLSISIVNGTLPDTSYYKPNLSIESEKAIDENGVYLKTIYQWYVSREGFTAKYYFNSNPPLGLFPTFPQDYEIIPGANSSHLSNVKKDYMGKHLVLVATPAAQSGKMGAQVVSAPVYISGLPPASSAQLAFHLDASLMDMGNVVTDPFTHIKNVHAWSDFSGNGKNATQIVSARQPQLLFSTLTFSTNFSPTAFHHLKFNGSNSMSINDTGNVTASGMTVFAVAKNNPSNVNTSIINNSTGSSLNWNLSMSGFSAGSTTIGSPMGSVPPSEKWYVFGGSVGNSNVRYSVNGWHQDVPGAFSTANNNLQLAHNLFDGSYSNIDIAEVIMYKGVLTDSEYNDVVTYLRNKYAITG